MLGQLYLATRNQLSDDGLEFTPFLPEDSAALAERAQALVEWCEGLLYGLGMAGVGEQDRITSYNVCYTKLLRIATGMSHTIWRFWYSVRANTK